MPVPIEFSTEYVEANSPEDAQLFRPFLRSREPFRSLFENNPWLLPPDLSEPLPWGTGRYWDTTVARKHPYWKRIDLPVATKDIHRLREDFARWGYCLIEDALSPEQCRAFGSVCRR